ncbi:MAG TPA: biotin/lipoyl-containing protein, partial [Geodermatophilus sp.]|nr:biotin/lipoyl-containing protein [Geodermatophilus sp.]
AAAPEVPEGTVAVRAPLVGTFYVSPSPGAEPFVRVGDEVEPGQTLGIVEAMKLMNPIVADAAGVVAEVRIGDAESVEYDQVLFLLHPPGGPR